MNAVVLSNFDDIDLAEIAVGRLKADIPGISHVEISRPSFEEPEEHIVLPAATVGDGSSMGVGPVSGGVFPVVLNVGLSEEKPESSDYIPRSVTVRVTCRQQQRESVEAKLINLGGRHVRSFKQAQL
ncbi:MAG: hypothetical protein HFG27_00505 [Provencibacterium sp.]|nr:hypothetical protein [Provencibacterium sp.]